MSAMAEGSRHARSYPVNDAELAAAKRALLRVVGRGATSFTIGRTSARSAPRLGARYPGARLVKELWRGSAGKVTSMERELQLFARARFGSRIANANVGGGQQAPDATHVVYVVLHDECARAPAPVEIAGRDGTPVRVVGRRSAHCPTQGR